MLDCSLFLHRRWAGKYDDDQLFIRDALGDAKVMWKILKEKFEQTNSTACFIAVNDFLNIQKQPDESISVLIGRMDNALQRLHSSHKAELTLQAFEEELVYSMLLSALPKQLLLCSAYAVGRCYLL